MTMFLSKERCRLCSIIDTNDDAVTIKDNRMFSFTQKRKVMALYFDAENNAIKFCFIEYNVVRNVSITQIFVQFEN